MKRKLLGILLPVLILWSCGSPSKNTITGTIEGLEAGDKVFISIEDPEGSMFIPVDSAVVAENGSFLIETELTDAPVFLSYYKSGASFDPANAWNPKRFLEGYSNLSLTGSTGGWHYIKMTGGIYDHPELQDAFRVLQEGLEMQREALRVLDEGRKNGDEEMTQKGKDMIGQSNSVIMESMNMEMEFAKTHPDVAYSADIMRYRDDDFEAYQEMFNRLTPRVQQSPAGIYVKNHIDATLRTAAGAPALDFTAKTLTGEIFTLSGQKGKYILIDFWGSWCGPCRMANPKMVGLYDKLREKEAPIEFVGIATDEKNDNNWIQAIEEDGLNWVQINDRHLSSKESIKKRYGIIGVPQCILISPEGLILFNDHPNHVLPEIEKLFEI